MKGTGLMKYARFGLIAALAAAMPLMSLAAEKTLIFQNGLNGYEGTEDTYVMSSERDANRNFENNSGGAKYEFEWDGSDGGGRNFALMKFKDIFGDGPNQIPPGAQIVNAYVETTVSNAGSSNQSSKIYDLLVEWSQETATFDSVFPGLNDVEDPLIGEQVSETSVQVFHNPSNAGQAWKGEITPLVQEWSDGLANNGFVIVPSLESTNGFGHYSSETPLSKPVTRLTVDTSAGVFSFEEGVDGYEGVRDAWIGSNAERFYTNYGERQSIEIDRNADDNVSLGLLRFDDIVGDGPNQIPSGATVNSAQVSLWVQDGGRLVYVNEILPFSAEVLGVMVNTYFDESSVTYENFVEDGVYPKYGVEIAEAPVTDFIPAAFSQVDFDVTSSVKKWVAGQAPNYGWLLEPTTGDLVSFSASEGSESFGPPKLVVTFIAETGVNDYMMY